MKKFLLLALLMVTSLTGWAYDVVANDIYYNLESENKTAEVTYREMYYPTYTGSVEIPASIVIGGAEYSVTSIGEYAFYCCNGLTSVTIPTSVTSIGDNAFRGCFVLTSLIIPNSVTSIGNYAFHECSGLTSMTIPNSVTSVGSYAFYVCFGMISLTIGNSVTSIGSYAFYGCSGLTSVTIGNSVTSIGSYAFSELDVLTSVTIPNSVTTIESLAFYRCRSLASVTIPNSVTRIADYAFHSCKNLEEVYCYAEEVPNTGSDVFWDANIEYATLYVPASSVEAYKNADQWKEFGTILPIPSRQLDLADGTAYTNDEEYTAKLTYTRTFNNTSWQPLYVPFSMSPADWEAQGLEVARINGFYEYDDDENGTVDRSALEVLKVKSGRLMPSHPYLVRAKNVGEVIIELEDATVYPAEENSGYCCTFETGYTFMGTYSPIGQQELTAKGAYIMGGGKLTPSAGALKPMRWYMVRKSLGGQLLPELAEIKVYVSGDEDVDALDFVNAEKAAGQAYNLMGQKVSRDAKGIRIINGRKYVK